MAKETSLALPVDPPVELALVLVCEKCGKKTDSKKNPSHRLASHIKRLSKHELERGAVRAVLTSCLDICPEDRVAVAIVPTGRDSTTVFLETCVDDVEAASVAVLQVIQRLMPQ